MIYLDANASSQLRQPVGELLKTFADGEFGANPSSVHSQGRRARASLRRARESVLRLLGVGPSSSLVFTSGGTEACNLMLRGFLGAKLSASQHIISSPIEHPAVSEVLKSIHASGVELSTAEIDPNGRVILQSILEQVNERTVLVNIMTANNESGVIQPVSKIASSLRALGYQGLITSDFTQALGKSELKVSDLFASGIDAVAISGHKIGALAGIGALVFQKSELCRFIDPLLLGGPQEKGYRGGTENLIGALSFGVAADELIKQQAQEIASRHSLKEYLWTTLSERLGELRRYGAGESLSNTLLVGFGGCLGGDLVAALDIAGVAVSTGSACASGKQGVSDTVQEMEANSAAAKEVVRFSLDWSTTKSEIEQAVDIVVEVVGSIRKTRIRTAA